MKITLHTRLHRYVGHEGFIRVSYNDTDPHYWVESAGITRPHKSDALADAARLRSDLLAENGVTA